MYCVWQWWQVNHASLREKFRISERIATGNFLVPTKYMKEECFVELLSWIVLRMYLQKMCIGICMRRCLHKYAQDAWSFSNIPADKCISNSVVKQTIFLLVLEHIEHLLQKGYGFTIKDITLNFIIYNWNVKKILDDHYGDRIQFAPNPRRSESKS